MENTPHLYNTLVHVWVRLFWNEGELAENQ
jgi:hypothetical protein